MEASREVVDWPKARPELGELLIAVQGGRVTTKLSRLSNSTTR